jgi:hypothetical protein
MILYFGPYLNLKLKPDSKQSIRSVFYVIDPDDELCLFTNDNGSAFVIPNKKIFERKCSYDLSEVELITTDLDPNNIDDEWFNFKSYYNLQIKMLEKHFECNYCYGIVCGHI